MRFTNKVAIVTGSGAGLGKAYVKALAKEGAKVVIAEFSEKSGVETEKELRELGYDVTFVQTNVADEDNVIMTVQTTIEKYGRIDILINNAQATDNSVAPQFLETTTNEMLKKCYETGFLGTFYFTKHCLKYMKEQHYGRIVNTASYTGVYGMETFSAYGSQKEAIRSLTKVTAQEYGEFGITCNVICPGAMTASSKTWAQYDPEGYKAAMAPQPIKHLGDPDTEVAPAVMFLVSDDAKYVTAQTIGVDGGHTRF